MNGSCSHFFQELTYIYSQRQVIWYHGVGRVHGRTIRFRGNDTSTWKAQKYMKTAPDINGKLD